MAERYEQAATVVTSNLDFTEWDQAFPGNRLLASATVDRLRQWQVGTLEEQLPVVGHTDPSLD
ncbi:ATP-binding protein [Azoarcus sp. CIB]|uniref:ATP-binding protein n=1 Tax=Aromatoleum sp. (strain CIB) TaxID=198107 RepID=UPI00256FECAA|nr:ATP-binding protein [Azoarcus sp. CIB]